jgi:hypothetical protein
LGVNLKIKINYSIENQYLLNLQKVNYYHPLKMDLEIKKKVFQRVPSTGRKRDSRKIFLQKNPV